MVHETPSGKELCDCCFIYNRHSLIKPGTAPAWDAIQTVADRTLASIGGLVIPLPKDLGGKSASPKTLESELQPHIGTDEAGKGDYFGPLVSAAVFVNQESAVRLRQLGVRDSKTIADPKIRELAEKIRQMPDVRCAVTPINPRKYNDLYETFRKEGKNLNSLLAWGHGKSIETLLSAPGNRGLGAKYVVVDQFADKHYVEQRTRGQGYLFISAIKRRRISLWQRLPYSLVMGS